MPFWSKKRTVNCGDGRTIEVYKDSGEAYPFYAQNWSRNLNGAVKALREVEVSVGVETAKQLSGLFVRLDDANSAMQQKLRAIYEFYSGSPCAREAWFQIRLEQTLHEETLARRALIKLNYLQALAVSASAEIIHEKVNDAMRELEQSPQEVSRENAINTGLESVAAWGEKGGSP